jgi:hypothetical protein
MPDDRHHRSSSGAYGFRLVAAEQLPDLTVVDRDAPLVHFRWVRGTAPEDAREVGPDTVRVSHRGAGSITVRREPPEAVFVLPQPVPVAAIVHPAGTLPLSVLAHWRGDVTLHGGAFVRAGGAWGVCGGRNAGKSTTLALLAARGIPIVADDLLVIQRGEALAGPRCVDLRGDAADRFPAARSLGVVGARVRYRLPTAAAPARTPVRGIIVLEWSADGGTEVTPLELEERLALLHQHQYSGLFRQPPGRGMVDLLALPMLRLRRPADWGRGDEAIDRVLAAADAH